MNARRTLLVLVISFVIISVFNTAAAYSNNGVSLYVSDLPNEVEINQEFTFNVRIENGEGYSYFKIDATDGSTYSHMFSPEIANYTKTFTISLKTAGQHDLYVEAGSDVGVVSAIVVRFEITAMQSISQNLVPIVIGLGLLSLVAISAFIIQAHFKKNRITSDTGEVFLAC